MAHGGVIEVEVRLTGDVLVVARAFGRLYGSLVEAGHVFTPEDDLILGEAAELLARAVERARE